MTPIQRIIDQVYDIWEEKYYMYFFNNDWDSINYLVDDISDLREVESVDMYNGEYSDTEDFDGDMQPQKRYKICINTRYGQIYGYIQCNAAGPKNDPFKKYNIVVVLNNGMNESLKDTRLYKFMKEKLEKCQTFNEAKRLGKFILKRYGKVSLAVFIGMMVATYMVSEEQLEEMKALNSEEIESVDVDRNGRMVRNSNQYSDEDIEQAAEEVEAGKSAEEIRRDLEKIKRGEKLTNDSLEGIDYVYDGTVNTKGDFVKKPITWELINNSTIATVYNAVPAQCNADPRHTATGYELDMNNPQAHKVIAIERTMLDKYNLKMGDLVKIEGTKYDGVYQIQDKMNKRFAGQNKIDILVNSNIRTGKWKNIKIYRLKNTEYKQQIRKMNMADAGNQEKMDKKQS